MKKLIADISLCDADAYLCVTIISVIGHFGENKLRLLNLQVFMTVPLFGAIKKLIIEDIALNGGNRPEHRCFVSRRREE